MTPVLAHIGGLPVEELLSAAPAAGAALLGARLWWRRTRTRGHHPRAASRS